MPFHLNYPLAIAVLCYLCLVNLIAFLLMGVDKSRAKRHKWRISEKTLFLFPILGGPLGGLLGMSFFRHKTKHPKFTYGFPVLLILWTAAIVFVCYQLTNQ